VFFPKDEYSYSENLHEYEANPNPTFNRNWPTEYEKNTVFFFFGKK